MLSIYKNTRKWKKHLPSLGQPNAHSFCFFYSLIDSFTFRNLSFRLSNGSCSFVPTKTAYSATRPRQGEERSGEILRFFPRRRSRNQLFFFRSLAVPELSCFTGWYRAVAMVHDGIVSSPLRRHQYLKKQWDELGSCSTVVQRHRFLLTAMVLLTFLCTIYLYFAVTLGARHSCTGLTGKEKAMCQLENVQATVSKGKLKFL